MDNQFFQPIRIFLSLLFFSIGVFNISVAADDKINPDFHAAVKQGDVKSVEHHLSQNPNIVHVKWYNNWMPLHVAVDNQQAAVVKMLIVSGADINAQPAGDFYGTPLHIAASYGDMEIVQILIDAGADVNALNGYKQTPINKAEEGSYGAVIDLLISSGATVPQGYQHGITDLHNAISQNDNAVALSLIASGEDINAQTATQRLTPLMVAIQQNATDIAKELVAAGADLNLLNFDRENALHVAAFYGNVEIARLLLDKGMAVNPEKTIQVDSPLAKTLFGDHVEVAKLLIEHGAEISHTADVTNETLLHNAALFGSPKIAKLLIDSGADVNAKNFPLGKTPLDLAEMMRKHQVADILRSSGGQKSEHVIGEGERGGESEEVGMFSKIVIWILDWYFDDEYDETFKMPQ